MSLPEHVVEEWARRALSQLSLEELRELIANAIEALEGIIEETEVEDMTTAASEAGGILYAVAYDLDASYSPEEIYGSEARLFADSISEALEYIAALTYVDAESTISEIVAEISDYFGGLLPKDEIINAIIPEIQGSANEISARAEKLAETVDGIHAVFDYQRYEEQGLTENEKDELVKTIEEVIDELSAIHRLYLDIIKTVAEKLIEILRQLDEHLARIASEE